jgi:hypothetical protein
MNKLLAVSTLAFFAVTGCAYQTVSVKRLLDDPSHFNGKNVAVRGEIKEGEGALGLGEYRIDDGTGTLTVVTQHNGAPRKGAQVKVEGKFHGVGMFGNKSVAVLEEKKRID